MRRWDEFKRGFVDFLDFLDFGFLGFLAGMLALGAVTFFLVVGLVALAEAFF